MTLKNSRTLHQRERFTFCHSKLQRDTQAQTLARTQLRTNDYSKKTFEVLNRYLGLCVKPVAHWLCDQLYSLV